MAKKKEEKTNVMRVLEQKSIAYTAHTYPEDGPVDGVSVANYLGQNVEQVFKTLTAMGDKTGAVVFVIPCHMELDLKKCAAVSGNKRVELVAVKDLLALTGYIRGGCSPIGMKKKLPTYFDESAVLYDEITVSAGIKGCQLLLSSEKVVEFTDAVLADITAL